MVLIQEKKGHIKFTIIKEYLLTYFSMDNDRYQVIRVLEIHLIIGYSSFSFKFL